MVGKNILSYCRRAFALVLWQSKCFHFLVPLNISIIFLVSNTVGNQTADCVRNQENKPLNPKPQTLKTKKRLLKCNHKSSKALSGLVNLLQLHYSTLLEDVGDFVPYRLLFM